MNSTKKKRLKLAVSALLCALMMFALLPAASVFAADPAITLEFATNDTNGSITEWMLKGDADRDGKVTAADAQTAASHASKQVTLTGIALESADINNDTAVTGDDVSLITSVIAGNIALPNANFTFRVVDTPNAGFAVTNVRINDGNGYVDLTPEAPTSGTYALSIDAATRVATVTGQSHPYNGDVGVVFYHGLDPNKVAISLTYGSDANGSITEWMLMGDVSRDGKVMYGDAFMIKQHCVDAITLTGDALTAADVDGDSYIVSGDALLIDQLIANIVTLPNADFTFRVVDTPAAGYKVKDVTITTPNGTVTLSPTTLTSGTYALSIDAATGVATVTGQSLAENDVQFKHETAEYTIVYDGAGSDGGKVPTDSNTYKVGDTVTIPTDVPTKTGYTFKCWKVNPEYQPGDTFTFDTVHANAAAAGNVVTLTAQWTSNTPNAPKTGDGGDMTFYIALMLASLGGITVGTVMYEKKKITREEC